MMAGVLAVGLLRADVVEDAEEVVPGLDWVTLEAVKVDGTIVVVLDVEEVGVGSGKALHY